MKANRIRARGKQADLLPLQWGAENVLQNFDLVNYQSYSLSFQSNFDQIRGIDVKVGCSAGAFQPSPATARIKLLDDIGFITSPDPDGDISRV
jgi:hypothetical protein